MLVAICDDLIEQAQEVSDKITGINADIQTEIFTNIDEFWVTLKREPKRFFAIFMDMEWKGSAKTGVDYVSELHNMKCRSKIVCVTAYTLKYIEKLFWEDVKIFGVLNKPLELGSVEKLVEKLARAEDEAKETIVINYNNITETAQTSEIAYVQSAGHKTILHMIDGEKVFYASFGSIEKKLPKSFYCINKGIVVNMKYIKRIEQNTVLMDVAGEIVSLDITKRKKTDFKESYFEYIG